MAMSSSVHPVSRNRREENEMSRPFILQDGSESPAYSWDEHGLLRHWREDYPCPTCTCWFIHPSDVCSHVQSWHRPSGIYYGYPFTARDFTPPEPRKGKQPLAAGRSFLAGGNLPDSTAAHRSAIRIHPIEFPVFKTLGSSEVAGRP